MSFTRYMYQPSLGKSLANGAQMKSSQGVAESAWSFLSALTLFGIGAVAFVVGIVVFFGWLMKDRRSDRDPSVAQILISVTIGTVILASAIGCFVLAGKFLKRIARDDLPDQKVR